MGGQACVLYGAAEFSRDIDLHILLEDKTVGIFNELIVLLNAEVIAVPGFDRKYLDAGHAIHFRTKHPDVDNLRIDIMSKMRGVPEFTTLWGRRSTLELKDGTPINLLSLPDLVLAKKTQRDKDWPMIRRLIEADYYNIVNSNQAPNLDKIKFWLKELRTAQLLIDLAYTYKELTLKSEPIRPLLKFADLNDVDQLENALQEEEAIERKKDKEYWKPLKLELEKLRHERRLG